MLSNASQHALLFDDALQLAGRPLIEHHIAKPIRRVGDTQQVRKLTSRFGCTTNGHQLTCSVLPESRLARVDHVAQLFRQLAVAQFSFMRSHLHRDRIKMSVVATDVRFDERLELFRTGHDAINFNCWYLIVVHFRTVLSNRRSLPPLLFLEIHAHSPRYQQHQQPHRRVAPAPFQFGHVFEIHAVYSGDPG